MEKINWRIGENKFEKRSHEWVSNNSQIYSEDFVKFCGFLRSYVFYLPVWYLQDKILPRSGYRLTTNPDEEPNYVSLLMADGLRRRNVGSSAAQIGPVHDETTIPT